MARVEITQDGLGRAYELHVGDELVLRLKENPTTGFRWQVHLSDESVLRPVDDRFELGSVSPLPGSGGHRVMRFAAARAGTVQMSLANRQAWESESGRRESLSVSVW